MADIRTLVESYNTNRELGEKYRNEGKIKAAKDAFFAAVILAEQLSKEHPYEAQRKTFAEDGKWLVAQIGKLDKVKVPQPPEGGGQKGDENDYSERFKPLKKQNLKRTLKDIIGLADVKTAIKRKIILPIKYHELREEYRVFPGGGILLWGPPGTGKTSIAEAVAKEVESNFFEAKGTELVDKYIGESGKIIKGLFDTVRENRPAVLFIDEVDVLARSREADDKSSQAALPTLLAEMDVLGKNLNGILIIAATNIRDKLDAAFRSRMAYEIEVPLPNRAERIEMFKLFLKDRKEIANIEWEQIADLTAGRNEVSGDDKSERTGLSGRAIKSVCDLVRSTMLEEAVDTGKGKSVVVTQEMLSKCIRESLLK